MYTERLEYLRKEKGYTQTHVAKEIGISQKQYSRYEIGINEMPIRYLRKICIFYNVSADYILELPENLARPDPKRR